ncbi:hypothetical protein SAMN05518672_11579 [Chitinophaga sp. CF118]|uniref:hypothetical protein n=1 Tax=Chitinophaga sp. CF118 TaxID=1884367 RepID=UPI0008EBB711|nr:hypothetical protein [Chitinophaga sp. CF118]SFF07484.1 hypothetical protein SAMN05518672_11579 [Chitinophaga sp. CF118]
MYLDFVSVFDSVYNKDQGNLDAVIVALKESGATQMESAMLLIMKLKLSILEADALIINSTAWKENKDMTEKLRQEFNDYLESLD